MARHDREFWERAWREVQRGAKVGEVATRLRVRPDTLKWWCWRLGRERRTKQTRVPQATFLPVVVAQREAGPNSSLPVELEVNGARLRVPVGTDVQYVAALVGALRQSC